MFGAVELSLAAFTCSAGIVTLADDVALAVAFAVVLVATLMLPTGAFATAATAAESVTGVASTDTFCSLVSLEISF